MADLVQDIFAKEEIALSRKKTVTKIQSDYVKKYDAQQQRQQKKKQRLIRRLVLFSIVVVVAVGVMTMYHMKQRAQYASKQEEYNQLEEQLTVLQEEKNSFLEEIELLNNEDYVLEIARTNYFFSKKGELIFKILDEIPSY